MNILMIGRSTLYSSPGGDTTQIEMTALYLKKLGVNVDIALAEKKIKYDSYDLIHFFNVIRPDDIICHIKEKKPFVVSTIFVDFSEFEKIARKGLTGLIFKLLSPWQIEYVKSLARYLMKGDKIKSWYFFFHGQINSMLYVAKNAKLLLPNSHSEYHRLEELLQRKFPYRKVVNAIDVDVFNDDAIENKDFKNHILMVGRIEGRKNQLNVIKALMGLDCQLTIVGKPAPNQMAYYRECHKLASNYSNIHFVEEHMSHKKLVPIYKAAKVHVLASWFETTGLVSLEAAVMDCNIVITNRGDQKEYFMDMAYYCEPNDILSIKRAIFKAFNEPVNEKLKPFILANYTWQETAKQTLKSYNIALDIKGIILKNGW